MYILKNAIRCITRSKGRNILIGIIALAIAISACLGLSIRQAAETARTSALDSMSITATILYDRSGSYDRNDPSANKSGTPLSLEEYEYYAGADSVESFYYTVTSYVNGTYNFSAVTSDSTIDDDFIGSRPDDFPGMDFGMGTTGDFTLVGYSGHIGMTDFINGTAELYEGDMFEEGISNATCIVSYELATTNNLTKGSVITVCNPNAEYDEHHLTVVGFYKSEKTNEFSMSSIFGKSQDPANYIYMSAATLQSIVDKSSAALTGTDDEGANISGTLSATYTFADIAAFERFEEEVREMGLDSEYTVSSNLPAFENSLTPLNTLNKIAGWFLIIILIIGSIILVVLNIFNVRERKYEVGVLCAMGMKKWKVAAQFVCEILIITMIAIIIGAAIGAITSVPITNALLETQLASQTNQKMQIDKNFGGSFDFPGMGMGTPPENAPPFDFGGGRNPIGNMFGNTANMITEVNSAMNLTVVLEMIGVGLLLTFIASAASVMFVMRYDPLKILSNRD